MKKDKSLVGAAGEHLVLSRLLARGVLASQAPRGTEKVDILINPHNGGTPRLVQVKARTGVNANAGWTMNVKHEEIVDKNLFYAFVGLGEPESDVYIIPAKVVAKAVAESHAKWLKTPGAKGQQRNDTDMRRIRNRYGTGLKFAPDGWMDKYLEKWDLLG